MIFQRVTSFLAINKLRRSGVETSVVSFAANYNSLLIHYAVSPFPKNLWFSGNLSDVRRRRGIRNPNTCAQCLLNFRSAVLSGFLCLNPKLTLWLSLLIPKLFPAPLKKRGLFKKSIDFLNSPVLRKERSLWLLYLIN